MSGEELVGLADLELEAVIPAEIFPTPTVAGRRVLTAELWALAADLGAIRRAGAPEWIVERAACRLEVALNICSPSAAELVASGCDVDEAVSTALARGERFRLLVGDDRP